jgi:hypothetical protein
MLSIGAFTKNQTGASQIPIRKKAMTGPIHEVQMPTTIMAGIGKVRKPQNAMDMYVIQQIVRKILIQAHSLIGFPVVNRRTLLIPFSLG